MGYNVEYENGFKLNKPLTKKLAKFLKDFSYTRHFKRSIKGYGVEGEFFLDPDCKYEPRDEDYKNDASYINYIKNKYNIIDYNKPPVTQPGLWCQWVPSKDRTEIEWDGNEKFYNGPEWMQYIIENFLIPNGYFIIDGSTRVEDQSSYAYDKHAIQDEDGYNGRMTIKDNIVHMEYFTDDEAEEYY